MSIHDFSLAADSAQIRITLARPDTRVPLYLFVSISVALTEL